MAMSSDSRTNPVAWDQLSLLPTEVVEIELRIGVVSEANHLQWQLTVRDPSAGALFGMLSHPHTSIARWPAAYRDVCQALEAAFETHCSPF